MVSKTVKTPSAKSIAIMGATATGKSDLALHLAGRFDGEIVSMDSRQVYIGMNIGTAKVPESERRGIRHHLIDILHPDETNSAGSHTARAIEASRVIRESGKLPILVGGTGLYFRAAFNGLIDASIPEEDLANVRETLAKRDTSNLFEELRRIDPERADALSPNDRMRIIRALEIIMITGKPMSRHLADQVATPPWEGLKLVLTTPRAELRRRIANRTRRMFEAGWVEEVKRLLDKGYGIDAPGMKSLGYKEIAEAIIRGEDPHTTIDHVITTTRQYAKRQETFFRSEKDATWFDVTEKDYRRSITALLEDYLAA